MSLEPFKRRSLKDKILEKAKGKLKPLKVELKEDKQLEEIINKKVGVKKK